MIPHSLESLDTAEIERYRQLSMAERGRLLKLACQAAIRLERSKRAAGLPASTPVPWPESTWEFLKKNAQHAQP